MNIKELKDFSFPLDEQFELEVNYKKVKYEFLIKFSSTKKGVVCFGPAAYNPYEFSPPIYIRSSWHDDLKTSTIYYNDPTTYNYQDPSNYQKPELRAGWGVGKSEDYYLENIGKIIHILTEKNGISKEEIVFFGSSAGGFCSIMLATILKSPLAIANNPTVDTKNHSCFKDMARVCFKNYDDSSPYEHRLNIIEMFKKENYMPHLIYLININSESDFNEFNMLMQSLTSLKTLKNNKLQIIAYSDNNGHMGFYPKEEIISIMEDILDSTNNYQPFSRIHLSEKRIHNELLLKRQQIVELQTIKGYLKYKTNNIYQRIKKDSWKARLETYFQTRT